MHKKGMFLINAIRPPINLLADQIGDWNNGQRDHVNTMENAHGAHEIDSRRKK